MIFPGPDGTVHENVLTFRREYPDPPSDVWAALTEPDRLARWFGSYTGDARPGGAVAMTMTAEEDAGGPPSTVRILECEPERRLSLRIEMEGFEPWEIAVTLEPSPGGTVLHFRQALPDAFPVADIAIGWHWYLDRLAATLAGTAFAPWADYHPALVGRYA